MQLHDVNYQLSAPPLAPAGRCAAAAASRHPETKVQRLPGRRRLLHAAAARRHAAGRGPVRWAFLPPEGQTFIKENAFLLGVLFTILTRLLINEIRQRIEKPVLDEAGRRVAANLTPDADAIEPAAWAKLAGCVAMDAAGDASELVPVLGEFTDVAFAPLEAYLLKILFGSNVIAGFGFVEELLPFTDIIPTFTLAWCLSNLWPTTPLAQKLLPDSSKAGGGGSGDK